MHAENIHADIDAGQALISAKACTRQAPFSVDGRASHICAIYRAMGRGWKAADGSFVRLEFVEAIGGRATTAGSLRRFMQKLANPGAILKSPSSAAEHARAQKQLAAAGL